MWSGTFPTPLIIVDEVTKTWVLTTVKQSHTPFSRSHASDGKQSGMTVWGDVPALMYSMDALRLERRVPLARGGGVEEAGPTQRPQKDQTIFNLSSAAICTLCGRHSSLW